MMCDKCHEKPATVHAITAVNGQTTQTHMCLSCAAENAWPEGFTINDLIKGFMPEDDADAPAERCPSCGMDLDAFRRLGRVGCSQCYTAFRATMLPMLHRVHGQVEHKGKAPRAHQSGAAQKRRQLEELRLRMSEAIAKEAFEEAARLRDEMRTLEKGGASL